MLAASRRLSLGSSADASAFVRRKNRNVGTTATSVATKTGTTKRPSETQTHQGTSG
jgi:hypothetical protein